MADQLFDDLANSEGDEVIHTGQVNPNVAMNLIAQRPAEDCFPERVISCDGGHPTLGHPRVFINLDKPGVHACVHCGNRFYNSEVTKGDDLSIEHLNQDTGDAQENNQMIDDIFNELVAIEGLDDEQSLRAPSQITKAPKAAMTNTKPKFDKVTHTGQVNPNVAMNLIAQRPAEDCFPERVISCDGGHPTLGHPRVFINLDKPGVHACVHCGNRFYNSEVTKGDDLSIEHLNQDTGDAQENNQMIDDIFNELVAIEGLDDEQSLRAPSQITKAPKAAMTNTKPKFDKVTHTGQVNPNVAMNLIAQRPAEDCFPERVISCDGGHPTLGHPRVFINLDKPGVHACVHCGNRFYNSEVTKGDDLSIEHLNQDTGDAQENNQTIDDLFNDLDGIEGLDDEQLPPDTRRAKNSSARTRAPSQITKAPKAAMTNGQMADNHLFDDFGNYEFDDVTHTGQRRWRRQNRLPAFLEKTSSESDSDEAENPVSDRIAPSSEKIHREPIRDSRRTISAARISSSRPNAPSRSGGIRAPPSIAGRLSRPGQSSSSSASRRPESYSGRRPETDEVQRMREELRLREAGLERERETLRIERERIEREKLQLQVLQQQQQLAALKAKLEGTRSGRGDSRGHGQSSSSSRDKYAATSSRAAPEPRRFHEKVVTRPSRPADRRGHISQGDRSRSRHDSRSHHDEGRSRHEGHSRHEPRHEPRHYSSREAPPLIPGQNQYGSRDSYASASRDFDASRGTTSGSSWGQASWAGLPTAGDGWGVRGGGNAAGGEWSSSAYGSGGGGAGSSASNIRIDYDKYRRQY